MRAFVSLCLILLIVAILGQVVPEQAVTITISNSSAKLLQFNAGGHVLCFGDRYVYLAGLDHALKIEFVGSNRVQPSPEGADVSQINAKLLGTVAYKGVWKDTDITYTTSSGGIAESSYIVHPGGDPAEIRLKYNVPVKELPGGSLSFRFESGYITEDAPVAWQDIEGARKPVAVQYTLLAPNQVGFSVGSYDAEHSLNIDPTYQWHTFYGPADGSAAAESYGIAVDSAGNVYVTGYSDAAWNGPGDTPPINAFAANAANIVVVKLNSAGDYQWHTFYGAADSSSAGNAIAVDAAGNVYVTGYSYASWNGPGDTPPINAYPGSGQNIFILKLSDAGDYQWHTFYGATDNYVAGNGIAVYSGSDVYVIGNSSAAWNGPGDTPPLHDYTDSGDMVVVKLNSAGAYQWHAFYGPAEGTAAAVDSAGDVYLTGGSAAWNGPGDTPPLNAHTGNSINIVVIKLNSAGAYQWHTFYGTIVDSRGFGIAIGRAGDIYVAGYSGAGWNGPGDTPPLNPYQGDGHSSIVVIKLNNAGAYQWHTFYGPATLNDALARGIAADSAGSVYVTGYSDATWNGPGDTPPLNAFTGNEDIFILNLDSAGAYQWHTFYGPADNSAQGSGIAYDPAGNVYAAGSSYATWNGPGGIPPLNPFAGGYLDIPVVKMHSTQAPAPTVTGVSPDSGQQGQTLAVVITGNNLTNATAVSFGPGITVNNFVLNNASQITATITITEGADLGARNVSVTSTVGTGTLNNAFTVTAASISMFGTGTHGAGGFNTGNPTVAGSPMGLPNITPQGASLSADRVAPGTSLTVSAMMVNRGDADGTAAVRLYINGQEEAVQGVTLGAGSTALVTFTVTRSEPGNYSVNVNGVPAGSFTVDSDSSIILYISIALVAIAIAMGLIYFTRRKRTV